MGFKFQEFQPVIIFFLRKSSAKKLEQCQCQSKICTVRVFF